MPWRRCRRAGQAASRVLDFAEPGIEFPGLHLAMLVDDATFEALTARYDGSELA